MTSAQVRVYYEGIRGKVASQLLNHPGGIDAARSGDSFEVIKTSRQNFCVWERERDADWTLP